MDPTYRDLETRVKALRSTHGARVREIACVNAPRTLLCVELGDASAETIALSAGVHGDEPAGPWALIDLLESDALDPRFAYRIWPCTNPSGYAAGTRANVEGMDVNRTFGRGGTSPESRAILTSNRDRTFALAIDLHEDCDSAGFYCYEYANGALGRAVVAAVEERGLPVEAMHTGYDLGFVLAEGAAQFERGMVLADPVREAEALGALSYTLALRRRAARQVLTLESPSQAAWDVRLAIHRTAVMAAIETLSQPIG
jgi:protein MpaA